MAASLLNLFSNKVQPLMVRKRGEKCTLAKELKSNNVENKNIIFIDYFMKKFKFPLVRNMPEREEYSKTKKFRQLQKLNKKNG